MIDIPDGLTGYLRSDLRTRDPGLARYGSWERDLMGESQMGDGARVRIRRRGLGFGAFLLVAALLVPQSAVALDTGSRTVEQIRQRWLQLAASYTGTPYETTPMTTAPYSAGSLKRAFLQDGLNALNYARYLAGLPDDVALDPTLTDRAQHGAVLVAATSLSHSPPQPADMDASFYSIGLGATSSSNLGKGHSSLTDFNTSCVGDSDMTNIDRLGHRRWLLDPPLLLTGMGFASNCSDTFVSGWSRMTPVDYDAVKWPCEGYFPVEMFGTGTAWSVTLNPDKYSWTVGAPGHTVTLRRVADGRTWTLTSADADKSGKYFNFETSGYGIANCFIFRPDAATLGSYSAGDAFDVTISGGITLKATGQPATISYRTTFMSQEYSVSDTTSRTYQLHYTAGSQGTLSGTASQTVSYKGSGTAVTAVPNAGYHFVSWSDGLLNATRTDANVTTDKSVTATFAANQLPKAIVYTPHAPSTMYRNLHYTIYGYVKPTHSSGYYLVQLNFYLRNSHWVYVYHSHIHARRYYYSSTMTKYKATVSLPHRGKWRVRAYHSDTGHSPSFSGYDYITVK